MVGFDVQFKPDGLQTYTCTAPAVAHVYMGRRRRRRCPIVTVYLRGEISAEPLTPPDRNLFDTPDRGHVQNSHQQRAYDAAYLWCCSKYYKPQASYGRWSDYLSTCATPSQHPQYPHTLKIRDVFYSNRYLPIRARVFTPTDDALHKFAPIVRRALLGKLVDGIMLTALTWFAPARLYLLQEASGLWESAHCR